MKMRLNETGVRQDETTVCKCLSIAAKECLLRGILENETK